MTYSFFMSCNTWCIPYGNINPKRVTWGVSITPNTHFFHVQLGIIPHTTTVTQHRKIYVHKKYTVWLQNAPISQSASSTPQNYAINTSSSFFHFPAGNIYNALCNDYFPSFVSIHNLLFAQQPHRQHRIRNELDLISHLLECSAPGLGLLSGL